MREKLQFFNGTPSFLGAGVCPHCKRLFYELSTNRIIFHEFVANPVEFGHTVGSQVFKWKLV